MSLRQCDKGAFPRVTTAILEVHSDEVWGVDWSHDGVYLASASRDKTVIIWRIGVRLLSAQVAIFLIGFPLYSSPRRNPRCESTWQN
jgi:WD40 repeat protein